MSEKSQFKFPSHFAIDVPDTTRWPLLHDPNTSNHMTLPDILAIFLQGKELEQYESKIVWLWMMGCMVINCLWVVPGACWRPLENINDHDDLKAIVVGDKFRDIESDDVMTITSVLMML